MEYEYNFFFPIVNPAEEGELYFRRHFFRAINVDCIAETVTSVFWVIIWISLSPAASLSKCYFIPCGYNNPGQLSFLEWHHKLRLSRG
jgi:hypothetical protein